MLKKLSLVLIFLSLTGGVAFAETCQPKPHWGFPAHKVARSSAWPKSCQNLVAAQIAEEKIPGSAVQISKAQWSQWVRLNSGSLPQHKIARLFENHWMPRVLSSGQAYSAYPLHKQARK
ncbi:hypothetical protein COW36_22295 [bacterium (Candidatus Blackallbacteria) CG17_big_fil_post_rev_8_21_14_2_50_48_46]|uniref:Uncharacterized protein n=1 Tax=bacterium (Candidatus Blackallbacteria) CG17_big_fil_post_rev_8_21_14_2_50_48_46 TaxID=2014261 RepID=A0A2M7FYQ4_9BACT|nr:MAG: hypothetical protein COW64_13725 [bacterium (Candidatus Blackallbacteria) CG18_big_fil_WC_8_21_14_2_50_49_26]PIW14346.1 MAG: hypothetical protein COW36_22295 [bacterium (Candidatus Blackallbacteria) CG17_big_fil_post_rev_8_21_14_2_50_48_46]PIW45615.1 MAG: hypothetical protein COW20_19900 [bacterium (Candidatus Blackallbacteria) CG13_big_fil_rev_8_21_14_2_50_49_14]